MSVTITRIFGFDSGHRVLGHESKCAHLHGHRYTAEVTVAADELDKLGRVIDFSKVKEIVGGWIDRQWDHNMILHPQDPLLAVIGNLARTSQTQLNALTGGKDVFVLDSNPTAENLSRYLFRVAKDLLAPHDITVVKIRLYETPNCWADYTES